MTETESHIWQAVKTVHLIAQDTSKSYSEQQTIGYFFGEHQHVADFLEACGHWPCRLVQVTTRTIREADVEAVKIAKARLRDAEQELRNITL